jgi:hypothetical protein
VRHDPHRSPRRQALAFLSVAALAWLSAADAQSWTPRPDLIEARQEVAAVWLDGAVYVMGGFAADGRTLATVERLREGADAWEAVAAMPVAVNHPAAVAVAGRLVVMGGYAGPGVRNPVDATQIYDPLTDTWRLGAPMPRPRGALAAAVSGDRVVAVGGARDGVAVADVASYDPVTDAWTQGPPLPTARDHLGAAALDGRVHAIGGRAGGDLTLRTHEVLDLAGPAWSAATPLPTGRSGHAVAAWGGCLYALGGEGNRARADGLFVEVERFVAATATWEALAPMAVPRHGMAAVAVPDALVVPGGATVAGFGAVRVVDALTPPPCGE